MVGLSRRAFQVALGALTLCAPAAVAVAVKGAPSAGEPPQTGTSQKPAARRMMQIDGEDIMHSDATGEGSAHNVTVTDPDGAIIRADTWKWNDHKKVAHASGHLSITDPQVDATADSAEVLYASAKKTVTLTGHVQLTLRSKQADAKSAAPAPAPVTVKDGKAEVTESEPAAQSARKYPVEVTCDRIEYHYARDVRHATLTGQFVAVQKLPDNTRTLHASSAEWFGLNDRVLLKAPVRFEDTKGRHGESDEDVELTTTEGAEGLHLKKSRYYVPVEDEDEIRPSANGQTKSSSPSGPAKTTPPGSPKPGVKPPNG